MGISNALQPILIRTGSSWTKEEALLAYSSVEKDLEVQHPDMLYTDLLAEVHKAIATRLGVQSTPEEDKAFGRSLAQWRVFPDTVEALAILKKYYKLIVLSNVDNNTFNTYTRPALEPRGEGTIFDLIITAQDNKVYKPDPAAYEAALRTISEKLAIPKEKVLVTAQSLTHDHVPANALGIASCFIDREGAYMGLDSHATYDFSFKTLAEMAAAREKGGGA